jgi:hypothetical protein
MIIYQEGGGEMFKKGTDGKKQGNNRIFLLAFFLIVLLFLLFSPGIYAQKDSSPHMKVAAEPYRVETLDAGPPVQNDKYEKIVQTVVDAINQGKDVSAYFQEKLFVFPSLWGMLRNELDPSINTQIFNLSVMEPDGEKIFLYGATVGRGDLNLFFRSKTNQALFKDLNGRKIRPANQKERDVFQSLVRYQIRGNPLTVVEGRKNTVLFYIEMDQIFIIEVISDYLMF